MGDPSLISVFFTEKLWRDIGFGWIETLSYYMKSLRERQIPYDITYMWNLKYDTNEFIYKTETDSQT